MNSEVFDDLLFVRLANVATAHRLARRAPHRPPPPVAVCGYAVKGNNHLKSGFACEIRIYGADCSTPCYISGLTGNRFSDLSGRYSRLRKNRPFLGINYLDNWEQIKSAGWRFSCQPELCLKPIARWCSDLLLNWVSWRPDTGSRSRR